METYATKELEQVCKSIDFINDKVDFNRQSIMGHSMGGHGALTLALRNPAKYVSVSAFAPIANPSAEDCPWGQKAFKGYLKDEKGLEDARCDGVGEDDGTWDDGKA